MNAWIELRQKISDKKLGSKTWLSDQKNLFKIIDRAESAKVSSLHAERASISNLRTIIKAAKKALAKEDYDGLSKLFQLAANLPTNELRLEIGSKQREPVMYKILKRSDAHYYNILLTSEQFKRVQESTKQYFEFNQQKEKNG